MKRCFRDLYDALVDQNYGSKNTHFSDMSWAQPGERAAKKHLDEFIDQGLIRYDSDRNNPVKNGQSGLSFYLHFGEDQFILIHPSASNQRYFPL